MRIRTKLTIGPIIMILLIWGIVLVGNGVIKDIKTEFEVLEQDIVPGAIVMSEMKEEVHEIETLTLTYVIEGDIVGRSGKQLKEEIQESTGELEKLAEEHREHETLEKKGRV